MSFEEMYMWLWAGFAAIMILISLWIVYRGIKNWKLSKNNRANILALISGIPEEERKVEVEVKVEEKEKGKSKKSEPLRSSGGDP